jgi:hypothetical protein
VTDSLKFIDYFAPQRRPFFQCAKRNGITGIVRYLSFDAAKNTDLQEFIDAEAEGLYQAWVWEDTGVGPWNFQRGYDRTRDAISLINSIGVRAGVRLDIGKYVIFHAIDEERSAAECVEYFNGAYTALKELGFPYYLGVYGGHKVTDANWPAVAVRWQTPAWSYGVVSPGDNLYQRVQQDLCGVQVDVNDIIGDPWWAYRKEDTMNGSDILAALEAEPSTKTRLYALVAGDIQAKVVAPEIDTETAIKDALGSLATRISTLAQAPALTADQAALLAARVTQAIGRILAKTAPTAPPSAPAGATYAGESVDGSYVAFYYPTDGKDHWFKDGTEVPAPAV